MQRVFEVALQKANDLLANKSVDRVLGWKRGEFFYDETPAVFHAAEELSDFVYDDFSGANLSKYLIDETKKDGKVLVMLKPCDTYSLNELVKEHRVDRSKIYALGVECGGTLDIYKIKELGIDGILGMEEKDGVLTFHTLYGDKTCNRSDVLLERCRSCKNHKKHVVYDELLESGEEIDLPEEDPFAPVRELEAKTPDERFAFWQSQLSKCIRCNACRNVCPACSCRTCVFDNDKSGVATKSNADDFEDQMYHIIRAFHVAGRCTDCGECTRVCSERIPLYLLHRKVVKDLDTYYGQYEAGADTDSRAPLVFYKQDDADPSIVSDQGGK